MSPEPGQAAQVDLYWRPGCGFCVRLMRQIEEFELPTVRHDIWEDPAAADVVRAAAAGNETVPTVVVGARTMVNPSFDAVLAAVEAEAPSLLPEQVDPARPRRRPTAFLDRLRRD